MVLRGPMLQGTIGRPNNLVEVLNPSLRSVEEVAGQVGTVLLLLTLAIVAVII